MSAVDDQLAAARADLTRLTPEAAHALQTSGEALLVDIRPIANRGDEGEIPGALPIERIHLEWRLDPAGDHRIDGFTPNTTVVVLCNEGYASSFAARDLKRLGLPRATDLIGGYRAWQAAGLPTQPGGTPAIP
ncbi:rhodanese-related sulfurtransferase [Actinokineospora baliensis]|uniref:rhodanese-like domain-containing protein n=1 Tax=Actinokineospora baliensis TaxID=547056 RepID=UPI0019586251|nr:rhodanese-like domain-containing protein [Actinokineospora baliensis]MBM7772693.1 rhodanese-related sulfurtransferase [Actinokineospora baliensis]